MIKKKCQHVLVFKISDSSHEPMTNKNQIVLNFKINDSDHEPRTNPIEDKFKKITKKNL
jgi:hypothetical protein